MPTRNLSRGSKSGLAPPRAKGFRFGLRTLFFLLAGVGVLSAVARSLVRGDPTMLLGIGAFCYGGIIAIPCYAFVGSLMVLTTTTVRGQRAGALLAAAVGATAWIWFVIAALGRWPQLCVVYSLVIVGIIAWLVRQDWQTPEGPSPESTLEKLMAAKRSCPHQKPADRTGT